MNDMADTQGPMTDLKQVVDSEIKEWHFHIYFHQRNAEEHHAALELRDAVLRLRRDGAFVAVPLFNVFFDPMGPHPVGSYEIWVPSESFVSVYSYLCMNRGELSILIHPLTCEERCVSPAPSSPIDPDALEIISSDHKFRHAWIGPSFPLDLSVLHERLEQVRLQYPSLKLGYSSRSPTFTLEERRRLGANIEHTLLGEKMAARAPRD